MRRFQFLGALLILPHTALTALETAVADDAFWPDYLHPLFQGQPVDYRVHLAVFVEPYLKFVLDGSKTVESRFSVHRCAPYGRVSRGDVILLKRTGGGVVGLCQASQVWNYALQPGALSEIKQLFGPAICPQGEDFWDVRARASFATLIRVGHARAIEPLVVPKRDRRGWVVLERPDGHGPLFR